MYNIIDKLGGALSVIGDILVELEEYANDDDLRRNLNTAICNNRRRFHRAFEKKGRMIRFKIWFLLM